MAKKPIFSVEEPVEKLSESKAVEEIKENKFNYRLQVFNPFNDYFYGQIINSDEGIQSIIDIGKTGNCNRIPR